MRAAITPVAEGRNTKRVLESADSTPRSTKRARDSMGGASGYGAQTPVSSGVGSLSGHPRSEEDDAAGGRAGRASAGRASGEKKKKEKSGGKASAPDDARQAATHMGVSASGAGERTEKQMGKTKKMKAKE